MIFYQLSPELITSHLLKETLISQLISFLPFLSKIRTSSIKILSCSYRIIQNPMSTKTASLTVMDNLRSVRIGNKSVSFFFLFYPFACFNMANHQNPACLLTLPKFKCHNHNYVYLNPANESVSFFTLPMEYFNTDTSQNLQFIVLVCVHHLKIDDVEITDDLNYVEKLQVLIRSGSFYLK